MITTFLVEHRWITTVAFWLLVVAGPVLGAWLVSRPRLATGLGLASLVPTLALTLVPSGVPSTVRCVAEWSLPTFGAVEIMANVLLFAVPVLLLGVGFRAPLRVLLVASLGSAAIEAVQAVATSLGRACTTGDWLANTVGAAMGAVLAILAIRLRPPVAARD